eukprot:3938470-Rhodomonas_salina.2
MGKLTSFEADVCNFCLCETRCKYIWKHLGCAESKHEFSEFSKIWLEQQGSTMPSHSEMERCFHDLSSKGTFNEHKERFLDIHQASGMTYGDYVVGMWCGYIDNLENAKREQEKRDIQHRDDMKAWVLASQDKSYNIQEWAHVLNEEALRRFKDLTR